MSDETVDDGQELTYAEALEAMDHASAGDILILRDHKTAELTKIFLEAVERRQYVYRVNYPDGYMVSILTGHGLVSFSVQPGGKTQFEVAKAPIHKSDCLDIGKQVLETQKRHDEDEKGWTTQTGRQFGRFYL